MSDTGLSRKEWRLATLPARLPRLSPLAINTYIEATCVSLSALGHAAEVTVTVDGDEAATATIRWEHPSDQAKNTHTLETTRTEHAGIVFSFLTVLELTSYTVIRGSVGNNGIDWFLAEVDNAFQDAARLEDSGINRGNLADIRSRERDKRRRIKRFYDNGLGSELKTYISITELSEPRTRFVRYE